MTATRATDLIGKGLKSLMCYGVRNTCKQIKQHHHASSQKTYRHIAECLLRGLHGVEVGGLNSPLRLIGTIMDYIDIIPLSEARTLFPEVADDLNIENLHIGDVSQKSIYEITGRRYDFVVANNVIEHVANPILFLKNLFGGLEEGGYLLISAPDKNMCFDRERDLTTFEHCLADYYLDMAEVDASHYIDFLFHLYPETFQTKNGFIDAYNSVKKRREHVHVWNKVTFDEFLNRAVNILDLDACTMFATVCDITSAENFTILRKGKGEGEREEKLQLSLSLLKLLYDARSDLQTAFPNMGTSLETQLSKLIQWALKSGEHQDTHAQMLEQYKSEYEYLTSNICMAIQLWEHIQC
ncbi:MAG: methyltransferase domain-containing protein [Clostridiales bacterium]|jgi:SAM-dependent methyltransferase|nr:methyltransferase domain-containing protein [Clostridiales bacterium]